MTGTEHIGDVHLDKEAVYGIHGAQDVPKCASAARRLRIGAHVHPALFQVKLRSELSYLERVNIQNRAIL